MRACSSMATKSRRGRPLNPGLDEHIIKASAQLLREVGFDQFRMQDVAERAQVGLGAVYRRWSSKQELIIEVLKSAIVDVSVESTDDLVGLRQQLSHMANLLPEQVELFPGLVAAINRDPELASTFRTAWLEPRIEALRTTIRNIADRPLPEKTVSLIADLAPSILLWRTVLVGEPVNDAFIDQFISQVMEPAITAATDAAAGGGSSQGKKATRRTRRGS